ncbi:hypothetical protein ACJMK2_016821 [Sinanodonta woodiana]|uniref:Glycosyltransferase n=1 Tax=Sinanodonta woodiana TaxID=1069815 RepID=A0ABD3UUZ2_SINWO
MPSTGRRTGMFSKIQFLLLILGLPSLIIPAFLVLLMADRRTNNHELFLQPKPMDTNVAVTMRTYAPNIVRDLKIPVPAPIPPMKRCTNTIWSEDCRDPCHKYNLLTKERQRKQMIFSCVKNKLNIRTLFTKKPKYIFKIQFKDSCLHRMTDKYCDDDKAVPNIVHYVWFGKMNFGFTHFLSFLSVFKIQKPCLILLHADYVPQGSLWKYFLQIAPNIVHVQRKQPKKIYKTKIPSIEHRADIAKLDALKEYGGIYLDTDEIILKSLDIFRKFEATVSLEQNGTVANSLIMARRNAPFIKLWMESYRTYTRADGSKHSNMVPFQLARNSKNRVHIAENLFATPNSKDLHKIYRDNFDWSKNYAIHMYTRLHDHFFDEKFSMETIQTMNNTAGAIARHIIYGSKDLCPKKG